jgi:hypothetical protein
MSFRWSTSSTLSNSRSSLKKTLPIGVSELENRSKAHKCVAYSMDKNVWEVWKDTYDINEGVSFPLDKDKW